MIAEVKREKPPLTVIKNIVTLASLWLHSYLSNGSIWTPGSNKKQSSETIQSLVICIWDWFFFWCFSIKPALPRFLMTRNLFAHMYTKVNDCDTSLDSWQLFWEVVMFCGVLYNSKPNNHNLNSIFVYFIDLHFTDESKNMTSYYLLNHKGIVEPKTQIMLSLTSAWLYSADIFKILVTTQFWLPWLPLFGQKTHFLWVISQNILFYGL